MLSLYGGAARNCEGVTRREMLRVGSLSLGGLAFGGLTLADVLRARAAQAASGRRAQDTAVILIWQAGGPSHIDMYDLKPLAPAEFRGEFQPISTNLSGVQISEHLPLQARIMDKLSVVRSATHKNPGHGMASHWMMTGYMPTTEVDDNLFPSMGSVVSRVRGPNAAGLPAYVTLPRKAAFSNAAYLGASYNPFTPDDDPNNATFQVRNLRLPGRVTTARLERRQSLLGDLDSLRRDVDARGTMQGLDKFYRDAWEMITSPVAQRAFDVNQEDPRLRDRYGRHDLGQSCLLARRLVESGVTFVTVQAGGGWDSHGDNFAQLKNQLLPKFDQALTALVSDLFERGLNQRVLVLAMGEFGRTPRINPQAGRDHWPGAMSVVYSGGGLRMGQVIGETNDKAEYPVNRPCSPGDVLSTVYHVLGIDHHQEFYDEARRPLAILREGAPIQELVG